MNAIHRVTIEEVKHSKQKELRIIDTLEPVMMAHKLIVDKKAIRHDWDAVADPKHSLFNQLVRITRDRGALAHDDQLDALAIGVGYWVDQVAQDTDEAVDRERENLRDMKPKKFVNQCLGRKFADTKVWFNVGGTTI